MSKNAGWFEILGAARELADDFTAAQLGVAASLGGTKSSTPSQIAAAWLNKFWTWGYVAKTGEVDGAGPRPATTWRLTPKGRECQLQESLESRFSRLLGAVKSYQESIGMGQTAETAAWKKLCKIVDEVDLSA